MNTQCKRLLSHLSRGRSVTTLTAMTELDIASLHRRLSDLRELGYTINKTWVKTNGTRYLKYTLGKA